MYFILILSSNRKYDFHYLELGQTAMVCVIFLTSIFLYHLPSWLSKKIQYSLFRKSASGPLLHRSFEKEQLSTANDVIAHSSPGFGDVNRNWEQV